VTRPLAVSARPPPGIRRVDAGSGGVRGRSLHPVALAGSEHAVTARRARVALDPGGDPGRSRHRSVDTGANGRAGLPIDPVAVRSGRLTVDAGAVRRGSQAVHPRDCALAPDAVATRGVGLGEDAVARAARGLRVAIDPVPGRRGRLAVDPVGRAARRGREPSTPLPEVEKQTPLTPYVDPLGARERPRTPPASGSSEVPYSPLPPSPPASPWNAAPANPVTWTIVGSVPTLVCPIFTGQQRSTCGRLAVQRGHRIVLPSFLHGRCHALAYGALSTK
jgi:hypothetical protein